MASPNLRCVPPDGKIYGNLRIKKTLRHQGGKSVYNKKLIGVFLFSISIPIWYLNLISSGIPDFQDALEYRSVSGIPIYLTVFQQWTFDSVSLICDGLLVSIGVGLLFYFIKGLPTYAGLLFGLLSRYALSLVLLLYVFIRVLVRDPTSLREMANLHDSRLEIMLALQFISTLCFSYMGALYGKRAAYFDPTDRDLGYLGGVPKKVWFLLLIASRPVVEFLSRLTIVQIYDVTGKITSMKFWRDTFSLSNLFSDDSARGVTGLLGHLIVIFFAWAIAASLFAFGLNAIRDKQVKHRWLRICAVFAFIPAVIIVVPILRNRTWFF